ncbi:MAG: DUF4363 family protein [Desulfotomaculaceae bacterium]|nr:DUF4363 family protein [Desulfotomaculaceae bacterium]
MMRLFLVLIIIFAIIVSFSFWTNHMLQASAGEILQKIEQIEQGMENNQWEQARAATAELEETLDKKAKWWPLVLNHQEIDNIEFSMVKAGEYITTKNTTHSWAQLSELKLMIRHIPEKESLTLENIF